MDFYSAICNVLHDGSITAVQGAIPGTLRIDISIDYLRERFHEPGKTIQIILTECSQFAYRNFDYDEFTTDISVIAALEPEILSAELRDGVCEVLCAKGILEVRALDGSLALGSGRTITLQELIGVADAYWTEWRERAQKQTSPPRN